MVSRPVTLALVAVGCMAAAGAGAYVAVRESRQAVAAGPAAAVAAAPAVSPAAAPVAVAETEAAVDPAPRPAAAPALEEKDAPVAASSRKAAERPEAAPADPAPDPAPKPRPRAAPVPPAQAPAPLPAPPELSVEPGAPVDLGQPVSVPAYEPPAPVPVYEDLIVAANSVLGLQLETSLSSETAEIEDPVEARVTRDVTVDGVAAIPAGSRALGTVVLVDRGGKVKSVARLGVRFHTLVLPDHTEVPISTDAIYREGESPTGGSVAKIGGAAVGGAILGALFGGARGAVMGGATGAAGGTAIVMSGDRDPATLPAGSTVTVRLISPVTVTVER